MWPSPNNEFRSSFISRCRLPFHRQQTWVPNRVLGLINLELTTDDRPRRFYFIDQFQSTFESWTVSQSLRNWLSAYVLIVCANINILTYLLTYLLTFLHAACDTLSTRAAKLGLGQQREVRWVVGQYVGIHAGIRTLKLKQWLLPDSKNNWHKVSQSSLSSRSPTPHRSLSLSLSLSDRFISLSDKLGRRRGWRNTYTHASSATTMEAAQHPILHFPFHVDPHWISVKAGLSAGAWGRHVYHPRGKGKRKRSMGYRRSGMVLGLRSKVKVRVRRKRRLCAWNRSVARELILFRRPLLWLNCVVYASLTVFMLGLGLTCLLYTSPSPRD